MPAQDAVARWCVMDGDARWVRSLFDAMPTAVAVDLARVYSLGWLIRGKRPGLETMQANKIMFPVYIPGWRRFPKLSGHITASALKWRAKKGGKNSRTHGGGREFGVHVYTLPYYAELCRQHASAKRVYFAFDPYQYYGWYCDAVEKQEQSMLEICDVVFAISQKLAEDFRKRTSKPVIYLPNATSREFLTRMREESSPLEILAQIPRPMVGCVGQINRSYDWDLIEALATREPKVSWVFVGPVFHEEDAIMSQINRVFAMPNVFHLGKQPHGDLPGFLQAFDVCFNPLAVNHHNDRRSPLRLYDYLATDRPILSTAIREAYEHEPHVMIGQDVASCVEILHRVFSSNEVIDLTKRRAYIEKNTWECRAQEMLAIVNSMELD